MAWSGRGKQSDDFRESSDGTSSAASQSDGRDRGDESEQQQQQQREDGASGGEWQFIEDHKKSSSPETCALTVRLDVGGLELRPLKTKQVLLQQPLPKPPVPPVNATLDRYLEYARVLATAGGPLGKNINYETTKKNVAEFRPLADKLQKRLQTLADQKDNWVNMFWLPEMYLRVRLAVPVNSSPAYAFPQRRFADLEEQLRYTAWLVRGMVDFKQLVEQRRLPRELSTGLDKQPVCMEQYDRLLRSYREPCPGEDIQFYKQVEPDDQHVLVMCYNQAFLVHTRIKGEQLPFSEILHQLREVVRRAENRNAALVTPLGACSAGARDAAANVWLKLREDEQNEQSLELARLASFVVCLDLERPSVVDDAAQQSEEAKLAARGRQLLTGGGSHRNGLNRWYDATIQLVVSSCGTSGFCIEHSTAEGIVMIHMAEYALKYERDNATLKQPDASRWRLSPEPLSWNVSDECRDLIRAQQRHFDELATELDLETLIFRDFGRRALKTAGCSPDGFIQLVMQLAHFRVHGYLVSTYESAALRRFRAGRVDNIRAATPEALAWCQSMVDPQSTRDAKQQALREAVKKQQTVTVENVTGHGIDNHLCALYVLAREATLSGEIDELPRIFSDEAWTQTMRFPLSTSQVTTSPAFPDQLLCYGAVVRDGYGCSYNLQNDAVVFAPSAFKSDPRTDLQKFKTELSRAMQDTYALL